MKRDLNAGLVIKAISDSKDIGKMNLVLKIVVDRDYYLFASVAVLHNINSF